MIVFFAFIIRQSAFPAWKFAPASAQFINVTQNVSTRALAQDTNFMWTNRSLDLAAQAFVIFAAAAGCLMILRTEGKEGESDD
jgi:hypothetical protein